MSPNKPSQSDSLLKLAGKKVLQAGLAATAAFGGINNAEAETHKGVMTVVGASATGTIGHSINVDFNAADPASSVFTADKVIFKQNIQAAADAMNYDHIIGDRFVITHEPKGTAANAAGLHLYWDLGGKKAIASNLQFNGSNVEDFDADDQFLFSEGDTSDQDQIIAQGTDKLTMQTTVKAYKLLKDENGKPIGLKLIGKTLLPSDVGEQMRAYKKILSATSNSEPSAWLFEQNADGTYTQKTKKDLSQEGVFAWSSSDRKPIFPTPTGVNITLPANNGVVRASADLSSIKEVKGGSAERLFGEYRARENDNGNTVIENAKGEIVVLPDNVKMIIEGGLTPISKSPETYVAMGYGQYILLTINSESPLKVTANVFANDLISKNYNKSGHFIVDAGKDTDGDKVYTPYDNAPNVPNPSQTDSDKDGLGDAQDATPGISGFTQSEMLPGSGFMFLCNPGKITKSINSNNGDDISFVNMAKGDVSTIQLIGQKDSKSDKLTMTIPAGFQIDASVIDGSVSANGQTINGTLTTSATTTLTFSPYTNVKLTFTNLGVVAPVDTGSTEKDAGSSSDTGTDAGSTGTDAASTDTAEQDTGKADTGTQEKDAGSTDTGTQNNADTGSNPQGGGNDAQKADAGSTGTDGSTDASTNGPEISQQPPATVAKTPSGCDANGKPLDATRTSAALGAAAALILAIRKRAKENGATQEELDKIQ